PPGPYRGTKPRAPVPLTGPPRYRRDRTAGRNRGHRYRSPAHRGTAGTVPRDETAGTGTAHRPTAGPPGPYRGTNTGRVRYRYRTRWPLRQRCTGHRCGHSRYRCVPVPLCTGTAMYRYRYVPVPLCTGTAMYRYRYVPVPLCTGTAMYRYRYVPVPLCTG